VTSLPLKPHKKDPHPAHTAGLACQPHAEVVEDAAKEKAEQDKQAAAEELRWQNIMEELRLLEERWQTLEQESLAMQAMDFNKRDNEEKEE
jgi:hypothetical protein